MQHRLYSSLEVIPLIWELTTVNAYILLPFTDFQSKVNNYYITNYHVISFNFRFKTSCRQNYQLITVKSKINLHCHTGI